MKEKAIKKSVLIFLLLCILCGAVSCARKKGNDGFGIYVINRSNNILKKITYEPKAEESYDRIKEVIEYLQGYKSSDFSSPFPEHVSLLGWKTNNNVIGFYFDSEYYNISVTDEVLMRSAIVLTMCQFSEIEGVIFYVDDVELSIQGKNVGKMTADSFLDDIMMTEGKIKLTLYFPAKDSDMLLEVEREVAYNAAYTDEQLVIEELLKGPGALEPSCVAGFSPETKLINVVTKDMICYVNLSSEFLEFQQGVSDSQAIYSLVNSLSEISGINSVIITVNGDTVPYYGTIPLGNPISFNFDLVDYPEDDLRR